MKGSVWFICLIKTRGQLRSTITILCLITRILDLPVTIISFSACLYRQLCTLEWSTFWDWLQPGRKYHPIALWSQGIQQQLTKYHLYDLFGLRLSRFCGWILSHKYVIPETALSLTGTSLTTTIAHILNIDQTSPLRKARQAVNFLPFISGSIFIYKGIYSLDQDFELKF